MNVNGSDKVRTVIYKLMQTNRLHRMAIEEVASSVGIHRSQHMMLSYLADFPETDFSQAEIAKEFDISPAAVAVTLKKLENGGYIVRSVNQGDNRYNTISVTKKGKDVIKELREKFDTVDKATFEEFTDSDFDALEACFDKMQRGLKKVKCRNEDKNDFRKEKLQ